MFWLLPISIYFVIALVGMGVARRGDRAARLVGAITVMGAVASFVLMVWFLFTGSLEFDGEPPPLFKAAEIGFFTSLALAYASLLLSGRRQSDPTTAKVLLAAALVFTAGFAVLAGLSIAEAGDLGNDPLLWRTGVGAGILALLAAAMRPFARGAGRDR